MTLEVVTFVDGIRRDEAEAATVDAAVLAAQTLLGDYLADGGRRRQFTVGFYVDGKLSRMATAQDIAPLASCEVALEIAAREGSV